MIDVDQFSIPSYRRAAQASLLRTTIAAAPARRRFLHRHRFAIAAIAVAALIATPALAVVSSWPPWSSPPTSPEEAAQQTGRPVSPRLQLTVDGATWNFFVYRDGSGALCNSTQTTVGDSDTPESATGCETPKTGPLFPAGPIRVFGPGMSHSEGSPSDRWDRLWLYGLAKPQVARLEIRFTDCVRRDVRIRTDAFEGAAAFAYVEPQELLHRKVLPYEIEAMDAAGRTLLKQPVAVTHEPNGEPRQPFACS